MLQFDLEQIQFDIYCDQNNNNNNKVHVFSKRNNKTATLERKRQCMNMD